MNSTNSELTEYLKNLILEINYTSGPTIGTSDDEIETLKGTILTKSFSDGTIFSKLRDGFEGLLPAKQCNSYEAKKWLGTLPSDLLKYMREAFDIEMNSTAYILKVLGNSVILFERMGPPSDRSRPFHE